MPNGLRMSIPDGWSMSRSEMIDWLSEAHRARHNAGPRRRKKARINSSSSGAVDQRVEAEEKRSAKSMAALNRKRKREDDLDEQHRRRVGASIRRIERSQAHRAATYSSPHHGLFELEPQTHRIRLREARDMYFEWIPRGIGKSETRNYSSGKPRIAAREAKWRSREFQDKILYIERPEALEEVEGNLVSNMGENAGERLACAERLEYLEPLSRKDAGVYTHVILALPAALSPEGRSRLLARLCSHLDRLELPHSAALHKPDPNNSQDNFHAHILLSLRPMHRSDGDWHFAASKRTWLGTPAGLKLQRRVIASEFNRALTAEGRDLHWTHRSRAADGLEPAGFTKRGGRRRQPHEEQVEKADADLASAEKFLLLVDEADRTAGQLQQIAVAIETCDERLAEMECRASQAHRALDGSIEQPIDVQQAPIVGRVANSQRQGLERELSAQSTPEKHREEQSLSPVPTAEPTPPKPDLALIESERQRHMRARRLEKARATLAKLDAAASPDERDAIASTFDVIAVAFRDGLLLSPRANGEIDMVMNDPQLRHTVEKEAMSTSGFAILKALASIQDEALIRDNGGAVSLVDPDEAFNWLVTMAGHGRTGPEVNN